MTRIQAISANRALLRTWIDDTHGEFNAATDRALRALHRDSQDEYALTPALTRLHAEKWQDEHPHVAELLHALADKLHEIED